jgi:hypothetical protein
MVDCIIPHGTLTKGVLNNIYPLEMGPSASMVGRQPRHSHQKDPFVYRGSHPCLDRNPRYCRTSITAHLAVIPSFLPFCQQSIPSASVNVKTRSQWSVQRGLETKFQRSIPHLPVHRHGILIRVISHPSSLRYLRDLLVRNSMSFVRGNDICENNVRTHRFRFD